MFIYDHGQLSATDLQSKGIRSTLELEEVIEGYSVGRRFFLDPVIGYQYILIGFTRNSRPLNVAFTVNKDIDIVTTDAEVPTVEEIINEFCRYCHATKQKLKHQNDGKRTRKRPPIF